MKEGNVTKFLAASVSEVKPDIIVFCSLLKVIGEVIDEITRFVYSEHDMCILRA